MAALRFGRASLLIAAIAAGCGYLPLPFGMVVNFAGFGGVPLSEAGLRARIRLPPGFSINTYAAGIPNARMLLFTPAGDLLASSPRSGRVMIVRRDADRDGYSDSIGVLAGGLDRPHGLALRAGWLYVGETGAVVRMRFDAATGSISGPRETVVGGLPRGGRHFTRTIGFGPDGMLYVSIGSSCNACVEEDPRRGAIVRYTADGGDERIYASGLRNAVGFAWRPGTGDLYATDNGRDYLGDDAPPCELDRIVEGGFYGWPFANGDRVPDPDLGEGHARDIARSLPPLHAFGAHTAPLGIAFYSGDVFPARYRGAAFVALHGSWNRSRKSGYEVVALLFAPDGSVSEEPFALGFETDDDVRGRPVDVAEGPDGALYVSDDFTGAIYRIAYGPAPRGAPIVFSDDADPPEVSDDAPDGARGRALYDANGCAACHEAGAGAATHRPLARLASRYSVDSLAAYLRAPQPPMPAVTLDDPALRDLAVHLLERFP